MGQEDDGCTEKQAMVVEGKFTHHEAEEKIIEAEVQNLKLSSPVKLVSSSSVVDEVSNWSSQCSDHAGGTEKDNPSVEFLPKSTDSHSPEPHKKLEQPKFHVVERKHHLPNNKSHHDEDDNYSLTSPTATSLRTAKITVPVAPKFTCVDRLQRRKEFYSKLEEKHKALEKEKVEYEARIKEEEQAALKLMRKNMNYKANPVPSFYHEGPPAKVELKKIPVTRAKSPNLSRRKSCSDTVMKLSPSEKAPVHGGATHRRSLGGTAKGTKASPLSLKSKAVNGSPCPNGATKVAVES